MSRTPLSKIVILSIDDKSFLSHRIPMALAAKKVADTVWVLCSDTGESDKIRELGFNVINVPLRSSKWNLIQNLKSLYQLFRIYHDVDPDLVFHSSVQMSFVGALACSFRPCVPIINSITGVGYLFSSDLFKAKVLRGLLRPLLRFLWTKPNVLMLFQNPDDRSLFFNNKLCAKNSPIICGSGVDVTKFNRDELSISANKKKIPIVIGCGSRLIRDKGISELIEALKLIENKFDVELQIAGQIYPSNPSSFTDADITKWSEIKSLRFLGKVEDMAGFWKRCNIAILPSHREGLPKSLLEAAASGLPLIGADVPGVREIVINGFNGFLFKKGDIEDLTKTLSRLIQDPSLMRSAGIASRQLIFDKKLDNDSIHEAFVELFETIQNRGPLAKNK